MTLDPTRFVQVEREITMDRGDFVLFGLFLRQTESGEKWYLMVSAPWATPTLEVYEYISSAIHAHAGTENINELSGIIVINTDNQQLEYLRANFPTKRSIIKVTDLTFFDEACPVVYIITCAPTDMEGADSAGTGYRNIWLQRLNRTRDRIQEQGNNPKWHRKAAYEALHLNDFASALEHDTLAVDLDPDYLEAWTGIVVAASFLGEVEVAQDAYSQVRRLDPDIGFSTGEASFYLGRLYFYNDRRLDAGPLLELSDALLSGRTDSYSVRLVRIARSLLALLDRME